MFPRRDKSHFAAISKAICAGFAKTEPKELGDPPKIDTAGKVIKRAVDIKRTPRVRQLEGIFDVPPSKRSEHEWRIDFTLDKPWMNSFLFSCESWMRQQSCCKPAS